MKPKARRLDPSRARGLAAGGPPVTGAVRRSSLLGHARHMGRLSRRQALVLLATAGAAGEGYLHFARGWSGGVPRSQAHGHGAAPSCADDSAGRLVAVGGRAANSRGPGRPTGPLRTPSMTPWILSV